MDSSVAGFVELFEVGLDVQKWDRMFLVFEVPSYMRVPILAHKQSKPPVMLSEGA